MANPHRGEVDLVAGETTYTLRMSMNSIAQLEQILDKSVNEISAMLSDSENVRVWLWRATLWAALQSSHKGTTLEDAGEIIGEVGLPEVLQKVGEAMTLGFAQSGSAEPKNPPKASSAGTGKRSKSSTAG